MKYLCRICYLLYKTYSKYSLTKNTIRTGLHNTNASHSFIIPWYIPVFRIQINLFYDGKTQQYTPQPPAGNRETLPLISTCRVPRKYYELLLFILYKYSLSFLQYSSNQLLLFFNVFCVVAPYTYVFCKHTSCCSGECCKIPY